MWYNGSMEVGDWITLGAVIVALGIGVASILHTQSLQKRERKERLLNEIIEWAIDISKAELRTDPTAIVAIENTKQSARVARAAFYEFASNLRGMRAKGHYVRRVTLIFGQHLRIEVEELMKELEVHIKLLGECQDAVKDAATADVVDKFKDALDKEDEHKVVLDESASKVIEKATKIKTGDIS